MELRTIEFGYALIDECESKQHPNAKVTLRNPNSATKVTIRLNETDYKAFRRDITDVVNKHVHEQFKSLAAPKIK